MKTIICILTSILAVSAIAAYDGWSEPILVADGETYTHYDKPYIALDLDGNYVIVHRRWDGDSDVYFTKIDQSGTVLVGPKPIIDTSYLEDLPVCVVASDNTIHVFYVRFEGSTDNIWYAHVSSEGDILDGPSLFVYTNTTGYSDSSVPAVTIEPDDTIHIAYKLDYEGDNLLGYSRYNPYTEDRFDVWGIKVSHPKVYHQNLNYNWDIAVDSEGSAHLFFDQTLDFNWTNATTVEVCWAKVPYDSVGEYESKIISRFYVDNFPDGEPSGTIDDNDTVHMVWSGRLDSQSGGLYYSMDKDGNEITGYKHILPDPFAGKTGRLKVRYNDDELVVMGVYSNDRYVYGRLNLIGDAILDFDYITDEGTVWDDNLYPAYIHHNNGFVDMVWSTDSDLWYQYTLDGFAADDPNLNASCADDGILLSWQEEGDLVGSTWRLERDGDQLVNLSGDALYRYLDREAEPGVTHLYTLEATLPDSSVRRFGPVEAAWPGPDADRLTLNAPYPCPATDQVTLSFHLPENTRNVEISLYDLSGRLVASSISLSTAPGRHEIAYDTSALPSGVYVARLTMDSASIITKRLVITR